VPQKLGTHYLRIFRHGWYCNPKVKTPALEGHPTPLDHLQTKSECTPLGNIQNNTSRAKAHVWPGARNGGKVACWHLSLILRLSMSCLASHEPQNKPMSCVELTVFNAHTLTRFPQRPRTCSLTPPHLGTYGNFACAWHTTCCCWYDDGPSCQNKPFYIARVE
jgi:hypothetical protein